MKAIKFSSFLFLLVLLSCQVYAAKGMWGKGFFSNVAISGYDPVAFFSGDGKPVKGSKEYQYCWHCATWYFANKANLDKFKKNPQQYAPQYGSWCAYAVAKGKLAPGYPQYATVYKNKLYFNYSAKVQEKWSSKKAEYIKMSDPNWQQLIKAGKLKICENMQSCN